MPCVASLNPTGDGFRGTGVFGMTGARVVRFLYVDQDVKETLRTCSLQWCLAVAKKIFNHLHIESAVAYTFYLLPFPGDLLRPLASGIHLDMLISITCGFRSIKVWFEFKRHIP